MKIVYTGVLAGVGLLAMACASSPQPTERLAAAQASIRAAKEIGAENVPQAQLHAQLAQEQVTAANKAMEDGDNERADLLLRRAAADAELAVALARENQIQQQALSAEATLSRQPSAPQNTMQATTDK